MDVDLVVLLVPGVHLPPVEGHVPVQSRTGGPGTGVAPGCRLRRPAADPHVPVDGLALARADAGATGRDQEVRPDVLPGKVVHGDLAGLAHEQDPTAVGDELAAEPDPHPARARLQLDTGVGDGFVHRVASSPGGHRGSHHVRMAIAPRRRSARTLRSSSGKSAPNCSSANEADTAPYPPPP